MDHIEPAWGHVKNHLVPYAVYSLVFFLVVAFTVGLAGLVLLPNLYRGLEKAMRANAAPDVGDLFNFDHAADDVVGMLLMAIGIAVGLFLCVLPGVALAILFFWVPLLLAARSYAPMDALKASLHAVKAEPVPVIIFLVVSGVVNNIASYLLVLPLLITFPVFSLAQVMWFGNHAGQIKQIAEGEGIPALS